MRRALLRGLLRTSPEHFLGFSLENMQCVGARASLPRALGSKCAPTAPSRAPAHGRSLKRDARGRSVSVRRMRWQTDARASHPPPHSFARARARELPVHKFSPTFPRMRPAFPCCQRAHPGLPRAGATRGVRAGTTSPHPPPPHPLPPFAPAPSAPRARAPWSLAGHRPPPDARPVARGRAAPLGEPPLRSHQTHAKSYSAQKRQSRASLHLEQVRQQHPRPNGSGWGQSQNSARTRLPVL